MYHHTNIHTSLFNEDSSWSSITIYLSVQALCNSVSVTPVSCQIKILVSVCHLPENFCTLSMTRSILTVPYAFLMNVSSLILLFSGQDASNWSRGRHYSCMFTCRSTSPWQPERVNGELHLCQNSGLAAAHNDCPCRNCSPWYRYAQANETRSAGVKSQLICS